MNTNLMLEYEFHLDISISQDGRIFKVCCTRVYNLKSLRHVRKNDTMSSDI
jgi:hypothetical protein